jgi:hypothetical protein
MNIKWRAVTVATVTVFWDVTPYGPVDIYRLFGGSDAYILRKENYHESAEQFRA